MSDLIRQFLKQRQPRPPAAPPAPMDGVSHAQGDFMRPPVPGSELWDGFMRHGDPRNGKIDMIPPLGKHIEDPDYPTEDPAVPPRHRRT
jgi:hypothetical protein